ncbi:MAG: sigma-54 interaction domain-containing protein [Candidatus Binatia bacterium]
MLPCFMECQPFGLILDALQDGVTIYDRNGDLIWINDKACQILGLLRAELIGRNVSEIATLPTVQALVTRDAAGRPLTALPTYSTQIEDYASPGYMVFTNGKKLLYMGTYVRDEDDAVQYAIYTIRAATDLDEARRKIDELQKLTTLYQDQLRTLHLQVLGQEIVARSEIMQKVLERALKFARVDGSVLLTGETGVGKNLLARYLHVMSRRAQGPFIHVNCATLPEPLIEAELFGYSEGAFTDAARKGRKGVIELGQGGTVFLDEIGDMPPGMQAKLLTVLEEKVIRRIGGEKWLPVDVRFVAATNKRPDTLVQGQSLREDLYYRLALHKLHIPPVRERPDDIPELIDYALTEFNRQSEARCAFHPDLVARLQTLPFPGNVREIKNLVWQIASELGGTGSEITWQMLPPDLLQTLESSGASLASGTRVATVLEHSIAEARRLRELCQRHQGDVTAIAKALGVHRTTVTRRLSAYGIVYTRKRM